MKGTSIVEVVPCESDETLTSAPNWDRIVDEIQCPLCGYNMRGLADARCPECGRVFEWRELLDPNRKKHPYLFEHHPNRNFWSFRRTILGGLSPTSFWKTLHPMQPSSMRRLALYVVLTMLASVVFLAAGIPAFFLARYGAYIDDWSDILNQPWLLIVVSMIVVVAIPFVWAFVTFLTFMIFGASMEMARVKRAHVVRAVVYSFDAVVVISFAMMCVNLVRLGNWLIVELTMIDWAVVDSAIFVGAAAGWTLSAVFRSASNRTNAQRRAMIGLGYTALVFAAVIVDSGFGRSPAGAAPIAISLVPVLWLLITIRLWLAFRSYLRFPHALAVVLTSQVITPLALMAAAFVIGKALNDLR